ncbi:MAG: calcium-binding protein [Paracoccus sp. (in: a-proteobacteria)]|uniref:calcium-binding protein n=1 Tax=Paracoccus sp. TaxID=267 RepID=UPI00405866F1
MLILGGLLGVLVAGLMVDVGGLSAGRDDSDDEVPDADGDVAGEGEAAPGDGAMILPLPEGEDLLPPEEDPLPPDGAPAPPVAGPEPPAEPALPAEPAQDIPEGGGDVTGRPAVPVGQEITGGDGDDNLAGLLGDDTLVGGAGNDWLQGDAAYGEGGDDILYGGFGDDLLAGQGGADLLFGDDGDDTLMGGEGDDTLYGGAGDDILAGHDGDDLLVSTGGTDDLDGGRGNDILIGHDGSETVWMNGGEGDDTLMPGAHDFASGNDGADTFELRPSTEGFPVIADFDATQDRLVLHVDAGVAQDAQLALRADHDGTFLLELNGSPVGRLLTHGGLRVEDVRLVAVNA